MYLHWCFYSNQHLGKQIMSTKQTSIAAVPCLWFRTQSLTKGEEEEAEEGVTVIVFISFSFTFFQGKIWFFDKFILERKNTHLEWSTSSLGWRSSRLAGRRSASAAAAGSAGRHKCVTNSACEGLIIYDPLCFGIFLNLANASPIQLGTFCPTPSPSSAWSPSSSPISVVALHAWHGKWTTDPHPRSLSVPLRRVSLHIPGSVCNV